MAERAAALPDGYRVVLDPRLRTIDSGRLLVGGSPLTAMRLSEAGTALISDGSITVTSPASAQVTERLLATNLGWPDPHSMPPVDPSRLTVVVPVRDRPAQLARCLDALAPLTIVVVDDGSDDPARVAAVARREHVTLVALASNQGPAAARNAGLSQVRTPLVAFVDSDVEVSAESLLRLGRHFADPGLALVGPRIEGVTRSERPRWFERYDATASSLTLGRTPSTVRPGAAAAWLPSACLVGRASALVDGFAADLRVGEDVDLVWRLVARGVRVRYDPQVVARHDVRSGMVSWLGRKAFYGSGGAALAARHGTHMAPAILSPTMALAAAALLQRRPWSIPVAAVAVVAGARSVERSIPGRTARVARLTLSAGVAGRGLGWAVRQESALLLRHWWPATAVACLVSTRVRRMVVTALVVDAAVALSERTAQTPHPAIVLVCRRLDDLAYGAGLWWGAVRARSLRCLLPRRPAR